jgi:glycosyltransferase involved in cell wall biosynthesis
MMDHNIVSVIMPAFNSEVYISEAIQSVIRQTYPHWELIVVDDGSTDKTREIVDGYMREDPRIRYIHQKNSGPAAARNRGIQASRGRYIAFLDSDDIWYLDKLEKQTDFLSSHPGYVVYGGRNYIVKEGIGFVESGQIRLFKNFDSIRENFEYILFHPNLTITSTVIFEKSLLDKIGIFDESPHICEDDNLFIRMAAHSNFHALNEPVDYRRKHDQSYSGAVGIQAASNRFRGILLAMKMIPEDRLAERKTNLLSRWSLTYSIGAFENKRYFASVLWFLRGIFVSPLYALHYFYGKIAKKIRNII